MYLFVILINKINGQNTHPKYTKYLKDNMGEDQ